MDLNKVLYETPEIITFSADEILDEITFAQGCTPSPAPDFG